MVLGLRAKVGEGQVGEFGGALGLFVAQGHARAVHAGWLAGWAGTGYWVWLLVARPAACSGMPLLYDDTVTKRYGDHAKSVGECTPGRISARIIRLVPLLADVAMGGRCDGVVGDRIQGQSRLRVRVSPYSHTRAL